MTSDLRGVFSTKTMNNRRAATTRARHNLKPFVWPRTLSRAQGDNQLLPVNPNSPWHCSMVALLRRQD